MERGTTALSLPAKIAKVPSVAWSSVIAGCVYKVGDHYLSSRHCFHQIFKMRAFTYFGILAGACLTVAFNAENVGRMGPAERAMAKANKPTRRELEPLTSHAAPLQKRASPYLNNKTSRKIDEELALMLI